MAKKTDRLISLLSLKGNGQSRGVFIRDCNRNLLDLLKKTKIIKDFC
ncbi:hypothetical protein EW15_0823 [Prochlorococcus sp. MIT 0801]|nr:hypothetical protein EW15_0823 [Prochlorococcus sp. MIT 0801]